MDIDFQAGNIFFSLLRFVIGAGAFGFGLWALMDIADFFRKKLPTSRNAMWKFWKNFATKVFIVLAAVVFFGVISGNAPKITLDYQNRKAVQPQGELSPESKQWREGWGARENEMRELDQETDDRTLNNGQ